MRLVAGICAAVVVGLSTAIPADPAMASPRTDQWYLDDLEIPQAHTLTRGQGVTVAVVDSGVHVAIVPSLAGQVLPGNGIGDAATPDGRTDTERGAGDFPGTDRAAVIAGRGATPEQVLGVSPGAKIQPVALSTGRGDEVARGLRWAVDHGAGVIDVTYPDGDSDKSALGAALAHARSKDVVVVVAVGDLDDDGPDGTWLGKQPGVVTVSGTDRGSGLWEGSSYGPQVALAAPAVDIVSGVEPGDVRNGTREAAAIVAGTAALVRSRFPRMDSVNVVNRLIRTAQDRGDPGRDAAYGFGQVQPYRALTADIPAVSGMTISTLLAGPVAPDHLGRPVRPSSPERTYDDRHVFNLWFVFVYGPVFAGLVFLVVMVILVVVHVVRDRRERR